MTILLLEDQGLIAIDLVEALQEHGLRVKAFAAAGEAELWLSNHRPTAAIVDCVLNDGDCTHLVRQLNQDGVPVVVYTGRHPSHLGPDFNGLEIFAKPAPTADLMHAIQNKLKGTPERSPLNQL